MLGVDVLEGTLRKNTPVVVPSKNMLTIGRVSIVGCFLTSDD